MVVAVVEPRDRGGEEIEEAKTREDRGGGETEDERRREDREGDETEEQTRQRKGFLRGIESRFSVCKKLVLPKCWRDKREWTHRIKVKLTLSREDNLNMS